MALVVMVLALTSIRGTNIAYADEGDLETALRLLATKNFNDTVTAIDHIVSSGAPHAIEIIDALGDRRLFVSETDKSILYRDVAGTFRDARTSEVVANPPAELAAIRINNRVRSAVAAARGALSLFDLDSQRRSEAARAVFAARDPALLSAVESALEREKEPDVAEILKLARAAIIVAKSDAPDNERIEAIEILRAYGGRDALAILGSLPSDTSEPIRHAAAAALSSIENRLALWRALENTWYGVSLGSVLLLAAIGLAITFGVMGVINMAHGEMVMLGAYTTYVVQEIIRTSAPGLFDYSLAFAIPLAFLVAGSVGIGIERGVIRLLYGRPLETLLATWGISLILQQAVRTIFGPTNREVGTPSFMTGTFQVGELAITWNRLYIVVFATIIFICLLLLLRFTTFGLQIRAVTQNRRMAGSMGIPTNRIDALTFGLGSGVAGLAGVALSQIDNVSPNLGQSYIIDSFLVVVFGGVGNLWGTLVGALSLGVANKFLEPYAGAVLGKILLLVLIILFIQKRPRGLFALKGRAVEA